jgi:hypothetical protein
MVRHGPSLGRDPTHIWRRLRRRPREALDPLRRLARIDEDRERPRPDSLLQQHDHVEVERVATDEGHRPRLLAAGILDQASGDVVELVGRQHHFAVAQQHQLT